MTHYTVIAYKPNSEATCRGCVMETFQSEFELLNTDNLDPFLDKWSDFLCRNMNRDRGESEFEITLLINGEDLADIGFTVGPGPDQDLYTNLYNKVNVMTAEKDTLFKQGVTLKQQAAERARKERERQEDLRQLAYLKNKLGVD